jgi:hypothetical protein
VASIRDQIREHRRRASHIGNVHTKRSECATVAGAMREIDGYRVNEAVHRRMLVGTTGSTLSVLLFGCGAAFQLFSPIGQQRDPVRVAGQAGVPLSEYGEERVVEAAHGAGRVPVAHPFDQRVHVD